MTFLKLGNPYMPTDSHSAILQSKAYPLPILRKVKGKIICDEGWSLSVSGSTWRIDTYEYCEDGRHLVLSGEEAAGQYDIFIETTLAWDDAARTVLDDETRSRVLRNITAAIQWAGHDVGFF